MGIWTDKAFGIDLSHWQASATLAEGSADFVICKCGGSDAGVYKDDRFAQHVQAAYDAKALVMAYWYVDSRYYTNRQMTMQNVTNQSNDQHPILQAILESMHAGTGWKAVSCLFLDVEDGTAGDVWDMTYCEDLRNRIAALRAAGKFPNIPLGIYSRSGIVDARPALRTWVEQHPELVVWTANYLMAFPGLTATNLAQVKEQRLPLTTQAPRWFGDNPAKPKTFKRFWQYHGSFAGGQPVTCPEILGGGGAPSALDLDVSEYTRAEMFAAFNATDRLGAIDPGDPPTGDPDLATLTKRVDDLETMYNDLAAHMNALQVRADKHIAP